MSHPESGESAIVGRRIAYNTVVQFIGRIIVAAIAIITTRLIAQRLGVTNYGRYTTIFAYVTFFGAISDFGFFWYLVREIARFKDRTAEITANVITLRTLFSLGVLVLAGGIAFLIPRYDSTVRLGIMLLALSNVWVSLSNTLIGVFQANQRMDYPVVNEVIGRLIGLGAIWYVISHRGDLLPIVIASLLGGLIVFLLNATLVRRYTSVRFGFDRHLWSEIMRENLSLGLSILLGIIYFKIDAVILSTLKPSVDVGIYGAPYRIIEILLAFPAMFMGAIFPDLSKYLHEQHQHIGILLQTAFNLLAMAGWGIAAGLMVLAEPIIRFTTKGETSFLTTSTITFFGIPATAAVVLQILAVAVGLAYLGNFFFSVIVANGNQNRLLVSNLTNSAVNILLNLLLIPFFTYLGAAFMTIVSELIVIAFGVVIVRQTLGFSPRLNVFWRSGLAAIVMSLWLFYSRTHYHLTVTIGVGMAIYVAALYLFGDLQPILVRIKRVER